jgi:hypothetical protein
MESHTVRQTHITEQILKYINGRYRFAIILASVLYGPLAFAAQQQWTVTGQIVADNVLPELAEMSGDRSGVAGITVKVSARSKILTGWGTWNSWGNLTTDANGNFRVSETHGGDRRQFKVEILFDSPKLRIKEGQESDIITFDKQGFPININIDLSAKDWHEVLNDKDGSASNGRNAGVINLGAINLTRTVVKEHASIWALYNKVFDLFQGYGPGYAFQKKVSIKYPMRLGSISYANPLNNNVYIDGGALDSGTLIHELMHVWEY